MLTVVIVMALGIAFGYLIRAAKRLVSLTDKLTMWAIYLLLFLLGIAIGANDVIIKNLPILGLKALIISLGGVMGSVLLAWVAYRIWFSPKRNEYEE
jgi:uncharacterized membrane protein YbjE (DUF340 family)